MSIWACVVAMLIVNGCAGATHPEASTKTILIKAGETFEVDGVADGNAQKLIASEDGHLFIHTTSFPSSSRETDLSGVREVLLFVPEKYIAIAKEKSVRLTKANGLQALEYSRNDWFPDSSCIQELDEGAISLRVEGAYAIVKSQLQTSVRNGPTDAKCDTSRFMASVKFPM